ncbi:hypothetical protein ACET8O_20275 [Aeromonas veronii]
MIKLDDLELPNQLEWGNEFDWTPLKQVITPTLTGALVIDQRITNIGRPINLLSNGGVWAARSLVTQLKQWEATLGKKMTLTLHDGRTFRVAFNADPVAVTAEPILRVNNPGPTSRYALDIKLIVIEETP